MKKNHVWIVEVLIPIAVNPFEGRWAPTVGVYMTRAEARRWKKEDWEYNEPYNTFRIRKYEAASDKE